MTQSSGAPRRGAPEIRAVKGKGATGAKKRRRFPWKGLSLTFLALFLLGIGLLGLAYSAVDIPTPNEVAKAEASILYYADGKTEMTRLSEVNRESVTIDKVPTKTREAVIAAEDRDFYDNPGISITGLGRAVLGAVKGEDAGGGSTITQQYVKNYFLTSDQTLTRKGKEIIIAVKIDREQSKDQILENYLNTIYYGRNAYGLKTAAKAYFGKDDVASLTVGESALLASVINEPSKLGAAKAADVQKNSLPRWNYVLDGMVSKGWITDAERKATTFPKVIDYQPKTRLGGTAGYLVKVATDELLERGIKQSDIDKAGLRITTTIDPAVQAQLVKAVDSNRPTTGRAAGVKVGAVSIKPKDGAIVALYGGRDFSTEEFNYATQGHMQAGSTMKTFAVLAGLQQGRSTKESYNSATPYTPPGTTDKINNWDFLSHGNVTVPEMLAKSINTAFVRMNEKVKPENTAKAAFAAGLPPNGATGVDTATWGLDNNAANVLGSAAVRPVDLANAYATIAGEGQRAKPYIVSEVKTSDNRVVYTTDKELTKAFEKDVVADTTDALRAVTRFGGTGSGASAVGRPVAGKTGTSEESKSAWFVGYTPEISTAVGMYLPDAKGVAQSMDGLPDLGSGELPLKVWAQFTKGYLDGHPAGEFPQRVGIGDEKVYTPPPPKPSTSTSTTTTTPPPTARTTEPGVPTSTTSRPGVPPRGPGTTTVAPPATGAGGIPTVPAEPPRAFAVPRGRQG